MYQILDPKLLVSLTSPGGLGAGLWLWGTGARRRPIPRVAVPAVKGRSVESKPQSGT